MDTTKFILKSKTMIGAILIFLSLVAPVLGFEFTETDANTLSGTIAAMLDTIMQVVGLLMVVWGRFTAETVITIVPGADTSKTSSPWFVSALAAVALLAGCITTAPSDATPAEKINALWDSAKLNVEIYKSFPVCEDGVIGFCSKASVTAKLDAAFAKAQGYVDLMNATIAEGGDSGEARKAAEQQLKILLTIYAVNAITAR